MNPFNHILIALDLTPMDDFLMGYSNFLAEKFQPKRMSFLHVMHNYNIPEEVRESFPDLNQPIPELIKDELVEKAEQLVQKKPGVDYDFVVREGYTTQHILEYTKAEKVTLTLMGKKVGYKGMGNIARKVASLTPSSVLMVNETAQPRIDNIHVRMNFNKVSELALKTAHTIADKTGAHVKCHNVFRYPVKYFPQPEFMSAEKLKKLENQLTKHYSKEYSKLIKRMKMNAEEIPCEYTFDKENDEAQKLYNKAIRDNADLIVIGSRVKSGLTDFILDHTSEKLTAAEKNLPVMLVKDRKQMLDFFEDLFD